MKGGAGSMKKKRKKGSKGQLVQTSAPSTNS